MPEILIVALSLMVIFIVAAGCAADLIPETFRSIKVRFTIGAVLTMFSVMYVLSGDWLRRRQHTQL